FLLLFSVGSHKPEVITVPEVKQDATVVVHVSRRSCQVHVQQYPGRSQRVDRRDFPDMPVPILGNEQEPRTGYNRTAQARMISLSPLER
ncbi:hypothetical protein, partial [Pseudomonas viridiflava]|uniref:hypothetical protein n=1 Tax=Pseudomonas viridiflava TaxID=33069 RepID=UPI00198037A6